MRRTSMLCRLALAGGATLLALTACSGGSNNNAASSSSSAAATSTSAAAITSSSAAAPAGDAAFCAQAQTFVSQVQAAVAAQAQHQADFGQKLPALVDQLKSVTPPPAIASDWQNALSSLEQLAQAFQGVNLSDPQQLQQLEAKVQPIETQLGASGQHIEDYLTNQCGIDVGGSSSSSTG